MSESASGVDPADHAPTVIRRVTPADAAQLKSIRLRAVRHDPDAFESTVASQEAQPDEAWHAWAGASSSGNDQVLFFAQRGLDVVGLVGAFRSDAEPRRMMLITMWVEPSARRGGVATALVRAVVRWAAAADADEVSLWVVDGNEGAVATYRQCGFEFSGDSKPFAGRPGQIEHRMTLAVGSGRKAPLGYVEFVPMSSYEFDTYVAAAVPRRAARLMERGTPTDVASRTALESVAELLPLGEATPGHHLCTLRVGEEENPVGWIWFSRDGGRQRGPVTLHDLYVFDAYRRQGFACAAIDELEEWAATQSCSSVAVVIAGSNVAGRGLFSGLGYVEQTHVDEWSIEFTKDLSGREIPPDSSLE